MKHTLLTRTARELQIWNWREQALAFVLALGVFTLLGPFETFGLPIGLRLLYWAVCLGAGWLVMIGSLTLVLRHPDLDEWAGPFRIGLAVSISTPATVFMVRITEDWLRPDRAPVHLGLFVFNVILVCGLLAVAVYLRVNVRIGRSNIECAPSASFFRRLPVEIGRDLISFSMQDHYVEVTTARGSALVLMTLGDAIEELGSFEGRRIHRSHWIAQSAFRGLARKNGKLYARLSDGRDLPVSRTYAKSVRTLEVAEHGDRG